MPLLGNPHLRSHYAAKMIAVVGASRPDEAPAIIEALIQAKQLIQVIRNLHWRFLSFGTSLPTEFSNLDGEIIAPHMTHPAKSSCLTHRILAKPAV